MDVLKLPFVEKTGIIRSPEGNLKLLFDETVLNHVGTIHACAQITLAETASGELLLSSLPDLVGTVVPVLREVQVTFRKPAVRTISAYASLSENDLSTFKDLFNRKGWSFISIRVEIRDAENVVTCTCSFKWYLKEEEDKRRYRT